MDDTSLDLKTPRSMPPDELITKWSNEIEQLFVSPKQKEKFIEQMQSTLQTYYGKDFTEFKGRYFLYISHIE